MATSKPETNLRTKMIARFRSLGTGRIRVVHGGPYGSTGEPDLDGVICGIPLKIEVKVPGNKPTPKQAQVLAEWEAAGAVAGWCTSVEEFDRLVLRALLRAFDQAPRQFGVQAAAAARVLGQNLYL